MVRAVSEIISKKPKKTLIFMLEAMMVSLAITTPVLLFFPEYGHVAPSYDLTLSLCAGAVVYGIGASINQSCAFGTMNQLSQGDFNFFGTVIGMVIGFAVLDRIGRFGIYYAHVSQDLEGNHSVYALVVLFVLAWVMIGWIALQFYQSTLSFRKKMEQLLFSPVARTHLSVFILGIGSGSLYLLLGTNWDYTSWLYHAQQYATYGVVSFDDQFEILGYTALSLVIGKVTAAYLSKNFYLRPLQISSILEKIFGGCLMGLGVGLIPGGNDTLILYSASGLATHTLPAMCVMGATIWVMLKIGQRLDQ